LSDWCSGDLLKGAEGENEFPVQEGPRDIVDGPLSEGSEPGISRDVVRTHLHRDIVQRRRIGTPQIRVLDVEGEWLVGSTGTSRNHLLRSPVEHLNLDALIRVVGRVYRHIDYLESQPTSEESEKT